MSFFGSRHYEILQALLRHQVDFVLIGGHAAIYYGVRRTTSDIDILVRPTLENGQRILSAFKDLRLDATDITPEDFTINQVFTFGAEPDAVDMLTYTKGLSTTEIFSGSQMHSIDSLDVRIIDIRDLLKNKESLDREGEKRLVDEQDILALRRILKSQ